MAARLYSIPAADTRLCGDCGTGGPVYAGRTGDVLCLACATASGGRPSPGTDCPVCQARSCGCQPGDPGCPHLLCPAFLVRGIVPDDPPERYASCPGAPREVVTIRESARALRMTFIALLSPERRERMLALMEDIGAL